MDNKNSVMNNLHRLENRTARSSQKEKSSSPDISNAIEALENKLENPAQIMTHNRDILPVSTSKNNKILTESLLRRMDDYRMTKKDLKLRLSLAEAEMQRDIAEMKRTLEKLEPVYNQISAQLKNLEDLPEVKTSIPMDSNELGQLCHKLEEMRISSFRTIASVESFRSENENNGSQTSFDLFSVGALQFSRIGFGFFLPVIIVSVLCSLIISVAIVCAFNGAIRW